MFIAIGRLDADSEGLLLLSDEAGLNTRLLIRSAPMRVFIGPKWKGFLLLKRFGETGARSGGARSQDIAVPGVDG